MSKILKHSILCVSVLLVFGFTSFASAEVVEYVYDFDNLSTGVDIADPSQDGWFVGGGNHTATNYIEVASGATSPMSGNYITKLGDDFSRNIFYRRVNDTNWSFDITADTDWELSVLTYVGSASTAPEGMAQIAEYTDGTYYGAAAFGVGSKTSSGIQWRVNMSTWSYSTTASSDGIYAVGMTAEALGSDTYNVTLWYESTPGDESTRTVYDEVENVVTDMTAYNSLTVALNCQGESYGTPMVDDVTIRVGTEDVPEPSAIALLTTGLIGLLAYAWKKRK